MSTMWPHREIVPFTLFWWNDHTGAYRKVIAMRDKTILEYKNFQNGWLNPVMRVFASYDAWLDDLGPGKTAVYAPYNIETEISNRLETIPCDSSDFCKVAMIHSLFEIDTRVYASPSPYDMLTLANNLVITSREEYSERKAANATPAELYQYSRIIRSRIALQKMRQKVFETAEPSKRYLPQFTIHTGPKKLIATKGGVEYPIALYANRILFNGFVADTFEQHGIDVHEDGTPRVTLLYGGKRTLV